MCYRRKFLNINLYLVKCKLRQKFSYYEYMKKLKIDFYNAQKVHFIGIGGVSMSALSVFLKNSGLKVSGSDLTENEFTKKLESFGIRVYIGHKAENIETADLVVYNSAIKLKNPELQCAIKKYIPIIERNKLLHEIAKNFKNVIAVSGCHGKTSTTALISEIFYKCNKNPTMHLGGTSSFFNSNFVIGRNKYFITEACEYKRNFLSLKPDAGIILNVDLDHTDYYSDLEDIKSAYFQFAKNIKPKGVVILNRDDKNSSFDIKHKSVGILNDAEYTAKNITDNGGKFGFDLYKKKKFMGGVQLNVFGYHNIYNALFSFAVCDYFKLNSKKIIKAINEFLGVKRRFESVGKINGALLISDYAHHPDEIKAAIFSAREISKDVVCVFQPHTYSRTKKFLHNFSQSFSGCDLILCDVYAAREKEDKQVLEKLAAECNKFAKSVKRVQKEDAYKYLNKNVYKGVILVLTAGDLHQSIMDSLEQNKLSQTETCLR